MSWLSEILDRLINRRRKLPPQPTIPPTVTPGDWRGELLALHNNARRTPLTVSQTLQNVAQKHADTMASRGRLYHQDIGPLMAGHGAVGENIAAGQSSSVMVFSDWMQSPGHRANIQSGAYSVVGFGRSGEFWCADFGER